MNELDMRKKNLYIMSIINYSVLMIIHNEFVVAIFKTKNELNALDCCLYYGLSFRYLILHGQLIDMDSNCPYKLCWILLCALNKKIIQVENHWWHVVYFHISLNLSIIKKSHDINLHRSSYSSVNLSQLDSISRCIFEFN